jgi:hypothetical protein
MILVTLEILEGSVDGHRTVSVDIKQREGQATEMELMHARFLRNRLLQAMRNVAMTHDGLEYREVLRGKGEGT